MAPNLHQLKSEQTRTRLVDAALSLMQEKGHGQLSMQEVARAAGMTTGAVQHHFPNKAALMLEIITQLIHRLESDEDFWPAGHWSLKRRADHFVREAWASLYGQKRFNVAWSAYLAVREDEQMLAHITAQRAGLMASLQQRMNQSFPEMCQGPQATARTQFVFSSLRGMGIVAPFTTHAAIAAQLQVLSHYLQSFKYEVIS